MGNWFRSVGFSFGVNVYNVEFYIGKLYDDLVDKQTDGEMTEEEMESKMDAISLLPVQELIKRYRALLKRKKLKRKKK